MTKRLISKINSNDSLYDGLFLIGEKAKNYLNKDVKNSHPIKNITANDDNVAQWMFNEYKNLPTTTNIDLEYFQKSENKKDFVNILTNNTLLIDYYLFGLHTYNSSLLVNFVSTTSSPQTALYNTVEDKLILFVFLPKRYYHYMSFDKQQELNSIIEKLNIPFFESPIHKSEQEYSFKGFILPHFILGIHDREKELFIFNPAILETDKKSVLEGLNVNQTDFNNFIKGTKYERFLTLTDNESWSETNAC